MIDVAVLLADSQLGLAIGWKPGGLSLPGAGGGSALLERAATVITGCLLR
jgi:hypothetical protein